MGNKWENRYKEIIPKNNLKHFSRDPNGATIALFNLHLHEPTDVSHQTVLQCVVFQVIGTRKHFYLF